MVWRIEDANGRVIKEVKNETKEVMNEMYAYTMIDLMKGVTRYCPLLAGAVFPLLFLFTLNFVPWAVNEMLV